VSLLLKLLTTSASRSMQRSRHTSSGTLLLPSSSEMHEISFPRMPQLQPLPTEPLKTYPEISTYSLGALSVRISPRSTITRRTSQRVDKPERPGKRCSNTQERTAQLLFLSRMFEARKRYGSTSCPNGLLQATRPHGTTAIRKIITCHKLGSGCT
jgi:hypothetical protein